MIVIVFGLPGSGKSFFASHLAEGIDATYISSDVIRRKMFAQRTYTPEEKLLVYNEMLSQMKRAVKKHKHVVLDATFYKNDLREKFLNETKDLDDAIFIEVRAEESVVKERLEKARQESEADFEVYKKIKTEWEPLTDEHLILQSTDDNIHEMLEKTFDHLYIKK